MDRIIWCPFPGRSTLGRIWLAAWAPACRAGSPKWLGICNWLGR